MPDRRAATYSSAVGSPAKDRGHLLRNCTHCECLFLGDYFAQYCPEHSQLNPIRKGRPPGTTKRRPRR